MSQALYVLSEEEGEDSDGDQSDNSYETMSKAQLEAKSEKSYLADPGGCPMTMQVCPHLGSPHLPLILTARRMFAGSKC